MTDKITSLIYKHPERWIHIREIARKLNISPETVRKHLAGLKKQDILEGRKEGNLLQFRANIGNENYKHEKILYNLGAIHDSGVADFLYEYYRPKAIVLFGSYARGEDLSRSDIDMGIVTSNKKRPNLSGFEKVLARKINLSLFTRKEVSNEFFTNIINGVVLKGILKNE